MYTGFDQETLDRQYSPSSLVPDVPAILAEYGARSARARAELPFRELRYGPGPRMTLDYFPAKGPLLVYVHGGYWQEMSKHDFSFPALGFVPAGVAFVALGYDLAPEYGLDHIVARVRQGLWWIVTHAAELGVDPGRVHLAGSSAGAHLVAMALLSGWTPSGQSPASLFAGAVLLSGIYDLEPIRRSYVNRLLGLGRDSARRNSPVLCPPERVPPLIVGRGAVETSEFARQQDEFVAALPCRVRELVVESRNHFDLTFDLADPTTALGGAVFAQLGL